jgi:hypothetical protein
VLPPIVKLKDRLEGLTIRFGAAATFRVTATVCGVLPALGDATLTVPVYVPAVNPAALMETLTLPGVVPPPLADSQLPPEVETV